MKEFNFTKLLAKTKAEARPYQQRIVTNTVNDYLVNGLRSILINSPTGSGKTCMALLVAKAVQTAMPGLEIGWISMRRNLLAQAMNENASPSKDNPKGKAVNARIHWISMFEKNLPPELLKAKKKMLIIDEAQHDAADSCAHIHANVRPDLILGMSATPFRTDRVKLCFDRVVNDAGLGALIRDGWLSKYHHYTIPKWSVKDAVETYLREPERWGQSLFYFHRIDQCHEATELLRQAGIAADTVTASSDRYEQIEQFEEKKLQVLVNCMVLTEGFDCPALQSVFCRPSCKGVTIQMCGRAFRKHPLVPVKNIVQSENTKWPFMKTALPECSYKWEKDMWLSLTPNKNIDKINCKVLATLATMTMSMPKYIIEQMMKKSGRSRRNWIGQ